MNLHALRADLERDEGLRLKPYVDSVGKTSIGIGRNLDDNGISEAEARFLFENDVKRAIADLDRNVPWWGELPEPAMRALVNMCFNLGWTKLSRFKYMLAALEVGDCETAADEALDSKYARQVGKRADRIAALFRGCKP